MTGPHLEAERISALLDEPWSDREAQAHLEACTGCRSEFERLSRLRMALSALPDEEPPPGQWAAIEAALDTGGSGRSAPPAVGRRFFRHSVMSGPLQAAAALVLFAGGLLAGLQLTSARGPDEGRGPAVLSSSGDDRALLDGLTRLETLTSPLRQADIRADGEAPDAGSVRGAFGDEVLTAQSLAQLDGVIRALRERLEATPSDLVANAYLLQAVETRDRLAEELGRSSATWTW